MAELDGEVVGHILFSAVRIVTRDGEVEALTLAPMAVHPGHQGRGIGSRLVEKGIAACRARGDRIAIVFGHPEFYSRFGFSAKLGEALGPFEGPAWMAMELLPGALDGVAGTVAYPEPFRGVGA